jgi:hypothetical protein
MSVQLPQMSEVEHPLSQDSSVQLPQMSEVEHPVRFPGWRPGFCLGTDGKWRPNSRRDTTERDLQIAVARTKAGKSIRAIAAENGCSVGTVHRVLSKFGLTP